MPQRYHAGPEGSGQAGASLREHYAGQALTGLLANRAYTLRSPSDSGWRRMLPSSRDEQWYAEEAVKLATALVEELAKHAER